MNIVSTIMSFVGPMIVNKIAANLGVNQGIAGKAIAAIVPALLAGMIGKSSTPAGAGALASVLGKQDTGMLGNLGNLIGGAGQQSMIDSGNSVLGSLLGGSSTSALTNAVGKFAGLGNSQSSSLMGMLAPVVLGSLAQTSKSSNLDATGLASMLAGQKSNVAAAMPAGFADLLGGSGLLDSLGSAAKSAASETASQKVSHVTDSSGGSMMRFLIPAALAALGLIWFTSGNADKVTEKVAVPAAAVPAAKDAVKMAMPGVELPGQVTTILGSLKTALGGVTDEASAKAALPAFTDILGQLDKVKSAAGALPVEARNPLMSMVKDSMPGIASLIEKALAIPGVGGVLKPVMDQINASLTAMGK
jgi:Bacterial protein of unknown function (DUF937)